MVGQQKKTSASKKKVTKEKDNDQKNLDIESHLRKPKEKINKKKGLARNPKKRKEPKEKKIRYISRSYTNPNKKERKTSKRKEK